MTTDIFSADLYIHADYDAVWNSFAQAEAYAAWSSAPCVAFGEKAGDAVRWGFPGRVVYEGALTRIEKGTGLSHTFHFVGFGFEEPPTTVEIDIVAQGPVTLVRLRHDCARAPRTAEMVGELGWAKSLSRLKTLLETGEAMPWPEE
jgi:uncharacterized protein YndB with AHSA1/START domain